MPYGKERKTSYTLSKLRDIRQVRDISLKEASELCGVSAGMLCRYEWGLRVTIERAEQIAEGLDVSFEELVGIVR